jgi:hypothetical protein
MTSSTTCGSPCHSVTALLNACLIT